MGSQLSSKPKSIAASNVKDGSNYAYTINHSGPVLAMSHWQNGGVGEGLTSLAA